MRDSMLVNVSGLPGHWMGIDLNIEHLIRYLKVSTTPSYLVVYLILGPRHCLRQRVSIQTGIGSGTYQLQSITSKE